YGDGFLIPLLLHQLQSARELALAARAAGCGPFNGGAGGEQQQEREHEQAREGPMSATSAAAGGNAARRRGREAASGVGMAWPEPAERERNPTEGGLVPHAPSALLPQDPHVF